MAGSLLLVNALVLDVDSGAYQESDLLIVDGRVAERGRIRSTSEDTRTVDLRGAPVLPGLIDCHVHVNAVNAHLGVIGTWSPSYVTAGAIQRMGAMLDRGFTSVRDTGGADHGLARAQEEGLVRGPRLFHGGRALSQTGGHGDKLPRGVRRFEEDACCAGTSRVVDGVDGVRRAAREELRLGAHHIKVHVSGGVSSPNDRVSSTQYSMDEIRAVVAEADAAERYVTVHAYPARAVNRALRAGVRCVEHGNQIDSESVDLFLDHGAFLVPTLVTYRYLKEEGPRYGLPADNWEKVGDLFDQGLAALERADRAGVRLAYGTDLLSGMNEHQTEEFRIRGEVQRPLGVIRSATTVAADLLGMSGLLGTLAPGAHADLVVLDSDPLDDLNVLADHHRHLRMVVQEGEVVVER
ncbi:amidohydrolase family protein [Spiractinospora alimapuensis]|uniref:metal-dependent hydrolase family protein n=1 Tax=Spiractinospora alimapuensis TaxID=2820884 RepID=UPI001F1CD679|nr:amidohydrolase family protein [Spiractinospora alimapuensis]QVQ53503.1 amidohydrolase family protein [Spiractinospora alimapuensis]